jgi:pimeloyl-ACP methyl ester carboxylesterase
VSWLGRSLDPYRDHPVGELVVPPLLPAQIVNVPGRGELFVRRGGPEHGTPVLLLHGWMATADLNWFLVYEELAARHPIITLDHRGHGRGIRSPRPVSLEDCADDAAALLRHLGIERAVVVGYSMGGPIAMLTWRRHPELVAGLVLEATAMTFDLSRRDRAIWSLLGGIGVLLRWQTGRIVLLRLSGGVEAVPEQLLPYRAWADGEFRRGDPMELIEAGRALARFDAREWAGEIDVPTAVVVTTDDRMVAPARQRAMARAVGAQEFEFAGDHNSVGTQAAEFVKVTLDAIDAVSS